MNNEHEGFEQYLRQFRPKRPAPLPAISKTTGRRRAFPWAALGFAALVSMFGVWLMTRQPQETRTRDVQAEVCGGDLPLSRAPSDLTMGTLSIYARRDPSCLDLVMSESARRVLPSVVHSKGALRVLASD